MRDFFSLLGLIFFFWLTILLVRACNNGMREDSSFAKEVAKTSRKVYDDVREGLELNDTTKVVKVDTLKKDTVHVDDWMKHK